MRPGRAGSGPGRWPPGPASPPASRGGSWWAYYKLGWGGWWFWDPVENASFMPWLIGTALLHSAIVVEKRDALKGWTILLAILTFGFSLHRHLPGALRRHHLGPCLRRRSRPRHLHPGAAAIAYRRRAAALRLARAGAQAAAGSSRPVSREGALVINNLLLATAAATVLLGTLYPLLLDAIGQGTVSVGPPYLQRDLRAASSLPLLAADRHRPAAGLEARRSSAARCSG